MDLWIKKAQIMGMLSIDTIKRLIPSSELTPEDWEQKFPPRPLPPGAEVTRFAPSPTGYVHIGGILVSLISESVAHQSGGVFILRVEDTDRERFVEDAVDQLGRALEFFGIRPDEAGTNGSYGPYQQSHRQSIYDSYVVDLLKRDRAYPCFCAKDQLAEMSKVQSAQGVDTGYWGEWARCRNLPEATVTQRLDAGDPYVIRFRSPEFTGKRIRYDDLIRGPLEKEDNRNDTVIRKTTGLPTYHFAHPVDDHLMRVTIMIRADEWLSSIPLHLQLFEALGFPLPRYAHIAPLLKSDGRSKRKLSKRNDPEAAVDFYVGAGYPSEGVLVYLRGLANSRLLDGAPREVLSAPLLLEDCSRGGQLVDIAKLDHVCREVIAEMTSDEIADRVLNWAEQFDLPLAQLIREDRQAIINALMIHQLPPTGPRKEIAKWSDFRDKAGFLVPAMFDPVTDPADPRFAPVAADLVIKLANRLADSYRHDAPPDEWFAQIRESAIALRFAATARDYKNNPQLPGSIKEAANIIRVLLTGRTTSPELYPITRTLGEPEVLRRLRAVG
ncbi:MAG: glutamyl-tRNA synthetase [Verrucomicrobiota bacterium]|jgi:glutamyl-tRNA synthetase